MSASETATTERTALTDYETAQVRRIAEWKSEPPDPWNELWKRLTVPVAKTVEKVVPQRAVRHAIARSYDTAGWIAAHHDIRQRAGVDDLSDLHQKPLRVCDQIAVESGVIAEAVAAIEGAATGAGGIFTTLLDVPILFILGLATVRRIGHCYGYPLERKQDRHFVLGVMIAAMAGSLTLRRDRINRLREIEELLIEESEEEVLTDEAISFLFQLEIFEGIPGVGVISGGLLNWLFMRRLEETARMVFQERWLQDNGKVDVIEPAPTPAHYLVHGWAGNLHRIAHFSGYAIGFGTAFSSHAFAKMFRKAATAPA